nr:MAG TPA: hypothetical protein [Caudoviricetes sp.]
MAVFFNAMISSQLDSVYWVQKRQKEKRKRRTETK